MASVTRWIDYQDLPAAAGGFSSLFLDYLRDGGAAERYFPATFRSGGGFESVMAAIGAHAPDRTTLTQVLNEQNTAFGAGQRTIENIAMLARPETFAVVTGQQVGLLGGPLYTVFKTITTIKLAAKLKVKYPDRNFVPVFWLEGEDHDFLEVNKIVLLDQEGKPVTIEYFPEGVPPERNMGPVGEIVFELSEMADVAAGAGTAMAANVGREGIDAARRQRIGKGMHGDAGAGGAVHHDRRAPR